MQKNELLYSGKAKSLFTTDKYDELLVEFRDDTSAFDGVKTAQLEQKGAVNNALNSFIMQHLSKCGIPCDFIEKISANTARVRRLDMIPVECVVRNISAGSLCRRLGTPQGIELSPPLYELFLKNDELHDPMINENHAINFGWATAEMLEKMHEYSLKINAELQSLFTDCGLVLVDAKYEFGVCNGEVMLGDEISPDSCRIWDAKTRETLDKDRFRKDMGSVVKSYSIIADRLGVSI
jgi:phosphoribosylaminoimidazole-succinocarboxamide synthase